MADAAYKSKAKDKCDSKKSSGSQLLCTFDLQKCLATPLLKTSVAFYKIHCGPTIQLYMIVVTKKSLLHVARSPSKTRSKQGSILPD